MSLEYFLGGAPIEQFNNNFLPTLQDVLRFYSNFWRVQCSDSTKEKLVTDALIRVYESNNIPVLSELTIKKKINKHVIELKAILKFVSKSESKTAKNTERERSFQLRLKEVFEIRRTLPLTHTPDAVATQCSIFENEAMEVDHTDDLIGIYNELEIGNFILNTFCSFF